MKIVFFGTPDFAVNALQALLQEGHTVTAVVTQPDKAKGRSKTPVFSPVKACAVKAGIPVLQPARVKLPEAVAALRAYEADVFVVAAFGQILSKEILVCRGLAASISMHPCFLLTVAQVLSSGR